MRRCLILTGGKLELAFARSFLKKEKFDKIIAVDGGLKAAKELDLIPDYIVGDFDSVSDEIREEFQKYPYIVWEQHKPEKNETDTELARNLALTLSCSEIVFLGATGGRIDHMIGNIHALKACMERGISACLVDAQNRIRLIDDSFCLSKTDQWGKYVSFAPYTEEVTGMTLTGFRYPLKDKTIRRGEEVGLCISNEIAEDTACVDLKEGVLLCIESRDENWTGQKY